MSPAANENVGAEIRTRAVIVGAGPAGLATSACLTRAGIDHVLLDRAPQVGASWRGHYERLHLHTPKGISALPHLPFPRAAPRYPSRNDVIAYLERYVTELGLKPRLGEAVTSIAPEGDAWTLGTTRARYRCAHVVVATGLARVPRLPGWPGDRDYRGQLLHSAQYRNGAPWRGRRVLVIGLGNSGGEIAVDLREHGAAPTLSVRGPVNVIPRDLLGIPILAVSAVLRALPPCLADLLARPLLRLGLGNLEALGLRRLPYGARTQVDLHGRVPLIDSGTIGEIRAGRIALRPGIQRFTADGVQFTDGRQEPFDAVVAATGYGPGLDQTLGELAAACGPTGLGARGALTLRPGLHLVGFRISTRGMLNQIRHDAIATARAIAAAPAL
jgi:indole-3-pyruvate monooxygenase